MTPEPVLSHASRVLTREQREFYFDNGLAAAREDRARRVARAAAGRRHGDRRGYPRDGAVEPWHQDLAYDPHDGTGLLDHRTLHQDRYGAEEDGGSFLYVTYAAADAIPIGPVHYPPVLLDKLGTPVE